MWVGDVVPSSSCSSVGSSTVIKRSGVVGKAGYNC